MRKFQCALSVIIAAVGCGARSPLPDYAANIVGEVPNADASTSQPSTPTGNTSTSRRVASAIVAAPKQSCAVLDDGSIQCWGAGDYDLEANDAATHSAVPLAISGITGAIALAYNGEHSCALLDKGTIQCWGDNTAGQLGNGVKASFGHPELDPVDVLSVIDAVSVTAGWGHSCALIAGGTLECWGHNYYGQLGNGNTNESLVAVPVLDITSATTVVSGSDHNCALLGGGTIQCWGYNYNFELGSNTGLDLSTGGLPPSTIPVTVLNITSAIAVAANSDKSCAVLKSGSAQCWGIIDLLERGSDYTMNMQTLEPVNIPGISSAIAISAGGSHSCVLLRDGTIQCWGDNSYGQLGDGTHNGYGLPVNVLGITNAIAVAAGGTHSCALLSGGSIECWGANGSGQLGNGNTSDSAVPVEVVGF